MKFLILSLLALASCSSVTDGKYKKKYHLEDYKSQMEPSVVHALLVSKMMACYPQSDYPVYEKTVSDFSSESSEGTISYEVDNQTMGHKKLVLVEVIKDPDASGSIVKIYSKGDLFRAAGVYKHQIRKWIDGQKVDCKSRGKI